MKACFGRNLLFPFKKITWISLFTVFVIGLSADPIVRISKQSIDKGEPLSVELEFSGKPNIQVPNQVMSSGGVSAEYVGTEENFSVINGKVSQKRKIKFRIVTAKDGKLKTPEISLVVDGNPYTANPIPFEVSKKKYEPPYDPLDPESIFEQFSGLKRKKRRRSIDHSDPDDHIVVFQLNRNRIYVGETLIGYYVLYYKNMEGVYIERNDVSPAEFSFFTNEVLYDVGIELPEQATLDGKTYKLQPYQKEIFALTALRKGNFDLGKGTFLLMDSGMEPFSSQKTLTARTSQVKVYPLPLPKPENFSGEVGTFSVEIISSGQQVSLGNSLPFTLQIKGEGTGLLFKNPLENYCKNDSCGARVVLLGEKRDRKFVRLPSGNYGFSTTIDFQYSLYPLKEGTLNLPGSEISYFNPNTENYESAYFSFPEIQVSEKKIIQTRTLEEENSFYEYLVLVLFLGSGVYLVIRFRGLIQEIVVNFIKQNGKIPESILGGVPEEIKKLDLLSGQKKDALLKNFLVERGFPEEIAHRLMLLKSENGDISFTEIFKKLKNPEKAETVKMVKEIYKKEK